MTPQAEQTLEPPDASDATRLAWTWLLSQKQQLGLPDLAIEPVADFVRRANQNPTTIEERRLIIDQATLMFDHVYPHMPFKQEIYHFLHPSDFLRTIPPLDQLSETDFHDFVIAGFSLVRDAHTLYGKPSPFRGAVAFLPFQMRPYLSQGSVVHYIVSAVMTAFQHPTFGPGAEILMWGPEHIDDHVRRAAGRLPGGTHAAVRTRGAIHCTVRPLAFVQMPFDDELPQSVIQYVPASGGDPLTIQLPWAAGTGFDTHTGLPNTAYSISMLSAASAASGFLLHDTTKYISTLKPVFHDPKSDSRLPDVFQFTYTGATQTVGTVTPSDLVSPRRPDGRFGYLRIASFGDA